MILYRTKTFVYFEWSIFYARNLPLFFFTKYINLYFTDQKCRVRMARSELLVTSFIKNIFLIKVP